MKNIKKGAIQQYGVDKVVDRYMSAIEEIINISTLEETLNKIEQKDKLTDVLEEILIQSKIEFNYEE